jgi:peptidoglycan hydrolase CwlO-like protein
MIKKAIIGSAAALVLGGFVFGREVFSYARTWGASVRNAVKAEVPLEFEIQRARELVENLVPDIRNCMHVIAEQQVDIEQLERDVAAKDRDMASQKEVILTLRGDLDSGKSNFRYASRTYTSDQVRRDLAVRFERFKAAELLIARDQQILQARKEALGHNEEKLDQMLVAKGDLEVQIEQLEARLKAVQAKQTVATLEIDDSQLARAKKLIRELNKQLDVREKMLDAQGKFSGLIPVEVEPQIPVDNITERIDEYFRGKDAGDDVQNEVAEATAGT